MKKRKEFIKRMRQSFCLLIVVSSLFMLTACPSDNEEENYRLEISPTSITLDDDDEGTFSVTSNTTWSVSTSASWLSFSTMSGVGNEKVTVRAKTANSGNTERSGTVTVSSGGDSKQVVVVQKGNIGVLPVAVDLGLPSGTLWADRNVGASTPEDYGDYFAWGETKPKDEYYWGNYIHYDDTEDTYHNLGSDIAGDIRYDAACANWGSPWRMPSKEQFEELIDNCTGEWTKQNGVNGFRFTSKTKGNSIFLPAAGNRWRWGELQGAGSNGDYWSSTHFVSFPGSAWGLAFNSGVVVTSYYFDGSRLVGRPVRPVR